MRHGILLLGAIALFATIEAVFYGLHYLGARRRGELQRRLQAIGKAGALGAELLRRGRVARNARLAAALRTTPGVRHAERLLEQADSSWTVAQLYGTCAAAGAAAAFGCAILGLGLAGALLIPVVAFCPVLAVISARQKRSRTLSEQLPEALETMGRSLRAGHAISSAFQVVASEMPQPINVEFARAYEEQRLGIALERAVENMAQRAPGNSDLRIFAVSVTIQKETGGNLAEILSKIAETIRARFRFRGKLQALTAEGRASALILGALPIIVAIAVAIMSPGYFAPLTTTPQGRGILVYCVVSWLAGITWLNRMTKLEY